MRPLHLLKNTGTYFLTGAIGQALMLGMWILMGRWLDPAQVGLYALTMFVVELFSAISIFGLDATITRFYYADLPVWTVFATALLIFAGSSVGALMLLWATTGTISGLISGLGGFLAGYRVIVGLMVVTNAAANLAFAHYIALRRAASYVRLQVVKTASFTVLALVLVRVGSGVTGLFQAFLASSFLVAVVFVAGERHAWSQVAVSSRVATQMGRYALPLMLYSTSGVLMAYFSRLLLDRVGGLNTVGVYGLFLILTLQVNGLWSSFNRAWTPEIFSEFARDRARTVETIRLVALLSTAVYLAGLAAVLLVGWLFLFRALFARAYLDQIHLLYILLLAPTFTAVYTATYPMYYYGHRTERVLGVSSLLSAGSLVLTLVLTRAYGPTGAAVSYLSSSALTTVVYLLAFGKPGEIPADLLWFSLALTILIGAAVGAFLKTSSLPLLLVGVGAGAVLAAQRGGLWSRRHLIVAAMVKVLARAGWQMQQT